MWLTWIKFFKKQSPWERTVVTCYKGCWEYMFYAYENPWASLFFLKHFSGGSKETQTDHICTHKPLLIASKGRREGMDC